MTGRLRAVDARVSGRVQGVSFRAWTQMEAQRLGVGGWVRNEADGSVRLLAIADDETLKLFLDRLWSGPRHAQVKNVAHEEAPVPGEGTGRFDIVG